MTALVTILRIVECLFLIASVAFPSLIDASTQREADDEKAQAPKNHPPYAFVAIAVGLLSMLLGWFYSTGMGWFVWTIVDAIVIALGLSVCVPRFGEFARPIFRRTVQAIRGEIPFYLQSLREKSREPAVRRTHFELRSDYYQAPKRFSTLSQNPESPSIIKVNAACSLCGATENLKRRSRRVELRSGAAGLKTVISSTLLGFGVDLYLFMWPRFQIREGAIDLDMMEASMVPWWTFVGFVVGAILSYTMTPRRYLKLAYARCGEHADRSLRSPQVLLFGDDVFVEFGSPDVKQHIVYGEDAGPKAETDATLAAQQIDTQAHQPAELPPVAIDEVEQPEADTISLAAPQRAPGMRPTQTTRRTGSIEPKKIHEFAFQQEKPAFWSLKFSPPKPDWTYPLAFSPDGTHLFAANTNVDRKESQLRSWNLETGTLDINASKKHLGYISVWNGRALFCRKAKSILEVLAVDFAATSAEETVLATFKYKDLVSAKAGEIDESDWMDFGLTLDFAQVHGDAASFSGWTMMNDIRVVIDILSGKKRFVVPAVYDKNRTSGLSVQGEIVFSRSGQYAAYLARRRFFVTAVATGKIVELPQEASALRFLPDERYALIHHGDAFALWDIARGVRLWLADGATKTYGELLDGGLFGAHLGCDLFFAFSPDMDQLLVNLNDGSVLCDFSLSEPPVPRARLASGKTITASAFAPQGNRVALGDSDGTVTVWEWS